MRLLLIFMIVGISSNALANFYNSSNQYKGFYWFEKEHVPKDNVKVEYQIPTPDEALAAIEIRKKVLDDARNQMIAVGFDPEAPESAKRQAIINYKKLEILIWDGALSLADASEMANFTNPELLDNHNQPTNVFGIKLKKKLEEEQNVISIMEFAKEFDLLLFAENSCRYCQEFTPVLQRFVSQYSFDLEVANLDSKAGNIAASMGITSVPTLIAIKKDGSLLFELSRGVVSAANLEESILLAIKYSKELVGKNIKLNKQQNLINQNLSKKYE